MEPAPDQSLPGAPPRRHREQVPAWFPRALIMTIGAVLATLGLLWVARRLGDLLGRLPIRGLGDLEHDPAIRRIRLDDA